MAFTVRSPVTEEQLAPLDDRPETVQFDTALTDADHSLLGRWFADHPAKTLRVFGSGDDSIADLDFLRWFPTLGSFQADVRSRSLRNIDGLGYLPDDVASIGLGRTGTVVSLAPLARSPGSSGSRSRATSRTSRSSASSASCAASTCGRSRSPTCRC